MTTIERSMELAIQVARRYYAVIGHSLARAAAALRLLVRIEQLTGFSAKSALYAARVA